jgi:hypothetical protein
VLAVALGDARKDKENRRKVLATTSGAAVNSRSGMPARA